MRESEMNALEKLALSKLDGRPERLERGSQEALAKVADLAARFAPIEKQIHDRAVLVAESRPTTLYYVLDKVDDDMRIASAIEDLKRDPKALAAAARAYLAERAKDEPAK
jgi:hypothetical protein